MITVSVPAKPYVKRFTEIRFGSPANLSKDPAVLSLFRRCLIKPSRRRESEYKKLPPNIYCHIIEVIISEDDFYRYGWELTNTDVIAFGKTIEYETKKFMRSVVAAYELCMTRKAAINKFQEDYGFSEDIWPYETILKDFYRSEASYAKEVKTVFADTFLKNYNKNMDNLSAKWTKCA